MMSLNSIGILCSIITSISHGLSSILLFLFFGMLITKSYSRYIDSLCFLKGFLRLILLASIISGISFPGTFNFIGECLTIITVINIDGVHAIVFIVNAFMATLYWILILNRKGSLNSLYYSINSYDMLILL